MPSKSTAKVSRGLRVLPKDKSSASSSHDVEAERDALAREIAQIERWWSDGRWRGTKRTYSGENPRASEGQRGHAFRSLYVSQEARFLTFFALLCAALIRRLQ